MNVGKTGRRIVWGLIVSAIALIMVGLLFHGTSSPVSSSDAAMRDLERKGVEFSQEAFIRFVSQGDFDTVELYIDAGINVNGVNSAGDTALCAAAKAGHLEIAELLLDHGADIDQVNDQGESPIALAGLNGRIPIIILLSQRGVKMQPYSESIPDGPVKLELLDAY